MDGTRMPLSSYLSSPDGYRRSLKEVARVGLRHDLRAAGATDEQIAAALDALRVALAAVTTEEFPGPADYAEAVAEVALRVTARYAAQGHAE